MYGLDPFLKALNVVHKEGAHKNPVVGPSFSPPPHGLCQVEEEKRRFTVSLKQSVCATSEPTLAHAYFTQEEEVRGGPQPGWSGRGDGESRFGSPISDEREGASQQAVLTRS